MEATRLNIDTFFDELFQKETHINWLPWVGVKFRDTSTKLFILGESTYNWDPSDEKVKYRIERQDHLRVLHANHALSFNRKSKYVRNIERAIFNERNPNDINKSNLWSSIVYHNLVLRPMRSLKERPSYEDYILGWEEFLKLLLITESSECIVYGLEYKKTNSLREILTQQDIKYEYIKLPDNVGRSRPKIISFDLNEKKIKILFIRHPSAFFNWKKWHDVLSREIDSIKKINFC